MIRPTVRPGVALLFLTVLLLTAPPGFSATIDVGTHYLLPDTPDQIISIYVHGTDEVSGMDFNVQVANGGPELEGIRDHYGLILGPGEGIDGPEIAYVNLVGRPRDRKPTIFGA
ncbi:MAG: hypothetical protein GY788_32500, partial [bacterium]|nr:hypothetical protein [bacterium]